MVWWEFYNLRVWLVYAFNLFEMFQICLLLHLVAIFSDFHKYYILPPLT